MDDVDFPTELCLALNKDTAMKLKLSNDILVEADSLKYQFQLVKESVITTDFLG